MIGEILVAIPTYLVDGAWGFWSRKAMPQTWDKISKGNRFIRFWSWFGFCVGVGLTFVPTYVVVTGMYLDYMISAPFKFWGASPGSFFWGTYLESFRPMIFAVIVWFVLWLLTYKSVNIWARFCLWTRPIVLVMVTIWAVLVVVYVPQFWEGWAMTFDFKWSTFLIPMVWTQAMLWVFWRSSLGAGLGTAFASYLPRGGDINTSVILNTISDALAIFIAGMALVPLMMGVAIPPLFAGSFGLVFSGLPTVWNKLGAPGPIVATLFYLISIPAAFPVLMASWEGWNTAIMDKFGIPRTRIITLTAIIGVILSIAYSIPIYDALNGESWGITLLFTQWYWGPVLLGISVVIEYQMLFYYFKTEKILDIVNEGSAIKIPEETSSTYST